MTHEHFEAIAKVMHRNDPEHTGGNALHVWTDILDDLTVELARLNPLFNSAEFRATCSGETKDEECYKPKLAWLWYHEELDDWQWSDEECADGFEGYVFIGEYARKEGE